MNVRWSLKACAGVSHLAKSKGFTLIEMVIAITILGITMALAYAALHVANRTISSVAKVQSDVEALRSTYFLLARHLSQASNRGLENARFQGRRNGLTFYSVVPMRALGGGRVYRFRLYQKQASDSLKELVLTYSPADPSHGGEQSSQVLAQFEGHLRFSYLAQSNDDVNESWQDSWNRSGLPQLVKLQLVDDAALFWPEQVVQLHYAGVQVE